MNANTTKELERLWGVELTESFCIKLKKLGVADKFLHSFNHEIKRNMVELETLELMTIGVYVAQGVYGNPLKFHLIACRRLGISKEKLITAMMHLTTFIGFPKIILSLDLIEAVYSSKIEE